MRPGQQQAAKAAAAPAPSGTKFFGFIAREKSDQMFEALDRVFKYRKEFRIKGYNSQQGSAKTLKEIFDKRDRQSPNAEALRKFFKDKLPTAQDYIVIDMDDANYNSTAAIQALNQAKVTFLVHKNLENKNEVCVFLPLAEDQFAKLKVHKGKTEDVRKAEGFYSEFDFNQPLGSWQSELIWGDGTCVQSLASLHRPASPTQNISSSGSSSPPSSGREADAGKKDEGIEKLGEKVEAAENTLKSFIESITDKTTAAGYATNISSISDALKDVLSAIAPPAGPQKDQVDTDKAKAQALIDAAKALQNVHAAVEKAKAELSELEKITGKLKSEEALKTTDEELRAMISAAKAIKNEVEKVGKEQEEIVRFEEDLRISFPELVKVKTKLDENGMQAISQAIAHLATLASSAAKDAATVAAESATKATTESDRAAEVAKVTEAVEKIETINRIVTKVIEEAQQAPSLEMDPSVASNADLIKAAIAAAVGASKQAAEKTQKIVELTPEEAARETIVAVKEAVKNAIKDAEKAVASAQQAVGQLSELSAQVRALIPEPPKKIDCISKAKAIKDSAAKKDGYVKQATDAQQALEKINVAAAKANLGAVTLPSLSSEVADAGRDLVAAETQLAEKTAAIAASVQSAQQVAAGIVQAIKPAEDYIEAAKEARDAHEQLKYVNVAGDGNCFYRSLVVILVAKALNNDKEALAKLAYDSIDKLKEFIQNNPKNWETVLAAALRKELVACVRTQESELLSDDKENVWARLYFQEKELGRSVEDFCKEHTTNGVWANAIIVEAAKAWLGKDKLAVREERQYRNPNSTQEMPKAYELALFSHPGDVGNHYNALLSEGELTALEQVKEGVKNQARSSEQKKKEIFAIPVDSKDQYFYLKVGPKGLSYLKINYKMVGEALECSVASTNTVINTNNFSLVCNQEKNWVAELPKNDPCCVETAESFDQFEINAHLALFDRKAAAEAKNIKVEVPAAFDPKQVQAVLKETPAQSFENLTKQVGKDELKQNLPPAEPKKSEDPNAHKTIWTYEFPKDKDKAEAVVETVVASLTVIQPVPAEKADKASPAPAIKYELETKHSFATHDEAERKKHYQKQALIFADLCRRSGLDLNRSTPFEVDVPEEHKVPEALDCLIAVGFRAVSCRGEFRSRDKKQQDVKAPKPQAVPASYGLTAEETPGSAAAPSSWLNSVRSTLGTAAAATASASRAAYGSLFPKGEEPPAVQELGEENRDDNENDSFFLTL